jgi:hypothetical protein
LLIALLLLAALLPGCDEDTGGFMAASTISDKGFLTSNSIPLSDGQPVRLWGFVDYGNLYGNAGARKVLGELWSGDGPTSASWRFNLKARKDDATGDSFAVHVPDDAGRDAVLKVFVANAQANKPTRLFLKGRIFSFAAPSGFVRHTGVYLILESSDDIAFAGDL